MTADPRLVVICLCTFDGARFLDELLASLLAQTHANWALRISDDGSRDDSWLICEAFRAQNPDRDIRLIRGPGRGAAANFLALLCHPQVPAGVVALSDQDDIWLPDKLARALVLLPEGPQPVIYSAQSRYIDAQGRPRGQSRPPPGPPVFATALLQNVLAGHSMVLNPAALALVRRAGPVAVPFHDWWLTLLVTAMGGRAVLDRQAVLLYRQHRDNVLGAPGGWQAGLRRGRAVFGFAFRDWVAANARALLMVDGLEPGVRAILVQFLADGSRGGLARLALLRRLGVRRQGAGQTMLVYLLAVIGRV